MATSHPTALLQQAVQLHQQGQLQQARALYQQVLALAPRQFDALHLLGVIERQRGDPARAVELIAAALQVDGSQARAHCNLGAALQDLGQPEEALASYDLALRLDPTYALAWDNRGNTLRRLGRATEALEAYERALSLRPGYPDAWCHRAILLHDLGRHAEGAASAERALAARPAWPDALLVLGNALQALERHEEAIAAYERALAQGGRADLWCARGAALKKSGALLDALASYEQALLLRPDYALAELYRANALRALGKREDAIAAYRRARDLGADAGETGFALAALGAADAPASAPPGYVKDLFDQYAGHFDRHLVGVLGYRTPSLLGELLRRNGIAAGGGAGQAAEAAAGTAAEPASGTATGPATEPATGIATGPAAGRPSARAPGDGVDDGNDGDSDGNDNDDGDGNDSNDSNDDDGNDGRSRAAARDVLDLGCGTGLCAPILRPLARRLAGVDLSEKMLDKARALALYDLLACADIADWLREQHAAWDLVVAADVLVYIGDLAPLFALVAQALRPGGMFAFSCETLDDANQRASHGQAKNKPSGYTLTASKRYAHAPGYVEATARAAGLRVLASEAATLRHEDGAAVAGLLVLLRAA